MRQVYQRTTFLFETLPYTQTLSSLTLVNSPILDSVSYFLGYLIFSPFLTLDHVISGLLLILPELDLVIYTSSYLLSTLLYYTSLQLGLVVSNPAIRSWCMDHIVTVYIVELLGSYYPKLDLLLYYLE